MTSKEVQGDLFGKPKKERRRKRTWTELDRLRRRIERLDARIEETGGTTQEIELRAGLKWTLIQREEEARKKWKNSFGS